LGGSVMPPLGEEGITEMFRCGRLYMFTAMGGQVGSGNMG